MGFGENGNGMGPADIAALMGANNGNNNGDALFGGNAWWIIVLLIMMFCCGGWGNGNGNGMGSVLPFMMMNQQPQVPAAAAYTDANVTRGFDQAAVMGAIQGVGNNVTAGFGDTALGLANLGQNVMSQGYQGQIAMMQGFNQMGSKFDNCCCENRLGIAQLGADVAREACADRQVVSEGLMNLTVQNNQNTNTIVNAINGVGQDLKNEFFAARMAEKDDLIAQLRQENLYARGQASQVAQNGQIVDAIYNRLSTCPVGTTPVYGQTPIFTCQNQNGPACPCGNVA